jgi:hypothetical protein
VTVLPTLGLETVPPGVVPIDLAAPAPVRQVRVGVKTGLTQQPPAARALELFRSTRQLPAART